MLTTVVSSLSFAGPALAPASRAPAVNMMAKSQSLPFMDTPPALDGSLPGDVGFDPFGFSDMGVPIEWMREAELKHGRVCMLATVGWLAVDAGLRAPGLPDELQSVNSWQAHDAAIGPLAVLLCFCGVAEIAGGAAVFASINGDREPGDFALTGGLGKTPEQMAKLKQAEIKHARLAMMAFSGIQTQSAIAHGDIAWPYF